MGKTRYRAVTTHFALGQDDAGTDPPDRQWVDGVALMVQEPTLHGEMMKANMAAQRELAAAVAERTGTRPDELYPQLVAATAGAAITVAMEHWMCADPPVPMAGILRDVLDQVAAGLPRP